jgi:hypothetical protein
MFHICKKFFTNEKLELLFSAALARARETAEGAASLRENPVDILVALYRRVVLVDQYHFVELMGARVADGIGIEDLKIRKFAGDAALGYGTLVHFWGVEQAHAARLATLHWSRSAAHSLLYAYSGHNKTLLGFVAKAAGPVNARRPFEFLDHGLVGPNTDLLLYFLARLFPGFLNIFV